MVFSCSPNIQRDGSHRLLVSGMNNSIEIYRVDGKQNVTNDDDLINEKISAAHISKLSVLDFQGHRLLV